MPDSCLNNQSKCTKCWLLHDYLSAFRSGWKVLKESGWSETVVEGAED